jgi:hypothetical protein
VVYHLHDQIRTIGYLCIIGLDTLNRQDVVIAF